MKNDRVQKAHLKELGEALTLAENTWKAWKEKSDELQKQNAELVAMVKELRKALEILSAWQTKDEVLGRGEYHQGLLCGVEDRGLQSDGYEAMWFGYTRALERVSEEIDETIKQTLSLPIPDPSCLSREIEKEVTPLADALKKGITVTWNLDDTQSALHFRIEAEKVLAQRYGLCEVYKCKKQGKW